MIPKLNPHGEALLQQFREQVPALEQLSKTVYDRWLGNWSVRATNMRL